MPPKPPLTQQQQRFVKNYIETLDATKSALNAGYSAATAKTKAIELLKNPAILAEIHANIESSAQTLKISDAYIVKKLLQIINSTYEEPQPQAINASIGVKTRFKDVSVALRAVDILAKITERQKGENTCSKPDNGIRVMCIENLNEDKI